MSQELAKRCIWLNRVYTPTAKTPENMTPGEGEAHRRLNILQKDLRVSSSQIVHLLNNRSVLLKNIYFKLVLSYLHVY